MATGIPSKRKNKSKNDYELTYSGKVKPNEFLDHQKQSCEEIIFGINNVTSASWKNLLYWGDNLNALTNLMYNEDFKGKVQLVYIDPPFSTGSIFQSRSLDHAYTDKLHDSEYIEYIRQRLLILYELLADNGSIYVHLDNNMAFQIKLILDEIFGSSNFRNWITRKKCSRKNYTKNSYGNISDYIMYYTKSDNYIWNRSYEPWSEEAIKKEYPCIDTLNGKRFKKVPVHAPGVRNGETGQEWKGMLPPKGKHWQYKPSILDEMDKNGEIYWSATGNPRRKIYAENSKGIPVQDIWLDLLDTQNQNAYITGYPTEKNPFLLDRIIEASTNKGDLVLDCFSGSGTTIARSERLGRRWVGIDSSYEAIITTLNRLSIGTKPMGIFARSSENANEKDASLLHKSSGENLRSNLVVKCISPCGDDRNQLDNIKQMQKSFMTHTAIRT